MIIVVKLNRNVHKPQATLPSKGKAIKCAQQLGQYIKLTVL